MNAYQFKKIKVLGLSTDYNKCDCCGKENLKHTVKILDLDFDVVLYFGTTCAAKANKFDNLAAYNEAKKDVKVFVNTLNRIKKDALSYNFNYLRRKFGILIEGQIMRPKCSKELAEDCYDKIVNWLIQGNKMIDFDYTE